MVSHDSAYIDKGQRPIVYVSRNRQNYSTGGAGDLDRNILKYVYNVLRTGWRPEVQETE